MKKILILFFIFAMTMLMAQIEVNVVNNDIVGPVWSTENYSSPFTTENFHVTNNHQKGSYVIKLVVNDIPDGWGLNFCHEGIDGMQDACHPGALPFTATINLNDTFELHTIISVTSSGIADFCYEISSGLLTEPVVIPFTFRTGDTPNDAVDLDELCLYENYPNPFNPKTNINYIVPKGENVSMVIYNMLGQVVKTCDDLKATGKKETFVWKGLDNNHNPVSSGVYFYKLSSGKKSKINKMILMK